MSHETVMAEGSVDRDASEPADCITEIPTHRQQELSQFGRLDAYGREVLTEHDVALLIKHFSSSVNELENFPALCAHLTTVVGSFPKMKGRLSKRLSAIAGGWKRVSQTKGSDSLACMDFAMFMCLKHDSSLMAYPTPKHVQRDATKIRDALETELLQFTYSDDGEFSKHVVGPQGHLIFFWDVAPTVVILLNTITIGASIEFHEESMWNIFELIFLGIYIAETVTKLFLYGWRWYFKGSEKSWNIFDFALLAISVIDQALVWADFKFVVVFKILRLSRLGRLLRSIKFSSELRRIMLGIASGLRVLFWATIILFLLIYAVGITAVSFLRELEPEFETLPSAMFSIFRCVTDGCEAYDGRPLAERLRQRYGLIFMAPYVMVYLGTSLVLFNLIMSVIVDGVMSFHQQRKLADQSDTTLEVEIDIKEELIRILLSSTAYGVPYEILQEIVSLTTAFESRAALVRTQFSILESSDVSISQKAFGEVMKSHLLLSKLQKADIETANSHTFFEGLDADMSGYLSIGEIFSGLMRLRGPICKSEIVAMRLKIRHLTRQFHKHIVSRRTDF
eukprot:TRINITY_DN18664_c0_g1_i1.p1 TRINITY_DN18664_c0_g1~~TRINITY_DN18664_c0_g1_i1.p1  ORF type:complete len:609 (+),score=78.14 TRINITY_DN18664_c0_g1_i1:134-1828(+)